LIPILSLTEGDTKMPTIVCNGKTVELIKNMITPPSTCPTCGGPVEHVGAFHRCTNDQCDARGIRKIRKWVETAKIKFYGPSAQQALYDAGLVTEPAHLYTVTLDQMASVIGGGNAANIMAEIDQKRELPLEIFMGGLGIPLLGRRQALKLMKGGIDTLEKFLTFKPEEVNIPGFKSSEEGNLTVISKGIQKVVSAITNLIDAGVKIAIYEKPATSVAEGDAKTVCFTGVRLKGEDIIIFGQLGYEEKSSVSKTLGLLVAFNAESTSNKAVKARGYGIPIMGFDDFTAQIRDEYNQQKQNKLGY